MTRIEGPLWRFCFRALVLPLYLSQKLFRAHHVLRFEYHDPCSRVRLYKTGNCTIAASVVDRLTGSLSRSFSAEVGGPHACTYDTYIHDLGLCPVRLLGYAEFEAYRRMVSSADAELQRSKSAARWFGRG